MTREPFRPDDDVSEERDELACAAPHCPNRWTVRTDAGWRLCSAHARSPEGLWNLVSNAQRQALAEAGLESTAPCWENTERAAAIARERLMRLRADLDNRSAGDRAPWAWARRLQQREAEGEALTDAQRKLWREALNWPAWARADAADPWGEFAADPHAT
jgi:hypothetical protein